MFDILLILSLPRLSYTWPSKVLERKEQQEEIRFYDYRKENNQISTLTNLSYVEEEVLSILVYHGVLDNTSISVILANIKQESNFNTLAYNQSEDAVGIFQWRLGRKRRLESRCPNISSVRCQMYFAFSEDDWKAIENDLKTTGKGFEFYQAAMKKFLRYGHFGSRMVYAKEYLRLLENDR